jgi:hypothetical protein
MLTYREENRAVQEMAALFLGPLVGLAYVVCMPFLTIVTIVALMGKKVLGGTLDVLRNLATFGWRPSEAYLSGRRRKKKGR